MPVLFFALWVILNGRLNGEIALFGLVLTAALYWFCVQYLDYSPKREWNSLRLVPGALRYALLVIAEIVKANIALTKLVYNPKAAVKPQLITFHTPLKSHALQSVLADSITVTPGTITVLAEDGDMTVHCLDDCFAKGIEDTAFQRLLLKLEAKKEGDA